MSAPTESATAQLALPGIEEGAEVEWTWAEDESDDMMPTSFVHVTVMRAEVVAAMAPVPGGVYVDATLGGGGHAEAVLEAEPEARLIGLDRDPIALEAAGQRLARFGDRVRLVHTTFGRVDRALEEIAQASVQGVYADLGVSSPQLDAAERGMSFRREGPIDMRMDQTSGETALELMERLDDDELANVIFRYGDERRSRRIARSIKKALEEGELATTLDLRRAIVRAVGPVRVGGVDPATRTFQALRIAVNREVEELEALLEALPRVVAPGGHAAIISFHSLEDRLVKQAFKGDDAWEVVTKRPLVPSDDEGAQNVRARSAKLRVARRAGED